MRKRIISLLLPLFFFSCYRVPDKIEPKISYGVEENYVQTLKAPFPPLSEEEKKTDWGKEFTIGIAFSKDFDLYRAISTFRRAEILIPSDDPHRVEISYYITLCYYLGKKYDEAIAYFEKSQLSHVDRSFSAYHDLLLMLYECYLELGETEKANKIHELIYQSDEQTGDKITLYSILMAANMQGIQEFAKYDNFSYLNNMLQDYQMYKKSVGGAQVLNAIIPGAGYLYVGLKKTALTAFLLNALFIFASYEFFHHGYIAAGVITTSFEMGWYFGGIYGAGEEAKFYNERVYESLASPMMNQQRLFPALLLKYAF
jgi:tetratricopeptide (TPR) repeat protein